MMKKVFSAVAILLVSLPSVGQTDWPMWRGQANRGNAIKETMLAQLHLQWTRQLAANIPAWPASQTRLQFDAVPHPVVASGRIFVPSSTHDTITAYDVENGKELWRFYAEGPIRFAPVVADDRVHFGSDDGYVYTLAASTGKLLWKFNAGPTERRIIGNDRLVSSWPVRGGPVLHQGKLYFTASIWPFMGIFIHCVEPATGERIWTNSGDGTNFIIHPHGAPSFGTVVPQGHLAATGNFLIVPGGRSTPAVYDTRTGKLLHFQFDGRYGGHEVMTGKEIYSVDDQFYSAADGTNIGKGDVIAWRDDVLLLDAGNGTIHVHARPANEIEQVTKIDRKGKKTEQKKVVLGQQYELRLQDYPGDSYCLVGDTLYCAGKNRVSAYSIKKDDSSSRSPLWSTEIRGEVDHMLASDGRLFVVTKDAKICVFGAQPADRQHHKLQVQKSTIDPAAAKDAKEVLASLNIKDGYCILAGMPTQDQIEAFLANSPCYFIAIDDNAERNSKLRRHFQNLGYYGKRISIHTGNPATFSLPKYLAKGIIVSDSVLKKGNVDQLLGNLYASLRPYGGALCYQGKALPFRFPGEQPVQKSSNQWKLIVREGPLPESDNWTHQYANASQSGVSRDKLVKAPLGLLWFGGPSNDAILPRHGHGPSPQVAGGRLFIEGPDMLRAVDVYTGKVLWEKELKDFGKYYNTTKHFAGAGEIGSNYVSMPDKVYAVYGNAILELDSATGKLTRDFRLKVEEGKEAPNWGFIAVSGKYLVATSSPVAVEPYRPKKKTAKTAIPDGAKVLISRNSTWRYLAGTDPKDLSWTTLAFQDEKWQKGEAGFGFGDDDDRTKLDMQGKYSRVYIRHAFSSKEIRTAKELGLVINFDDAFIVYLNGKEVGRVGVIKGNGSSAEGISSHEAGDFLYLPLEKWRDAIQPGNNILAIEGHNTSVTSSDFSLDPMLVVVPNRVVKNSAKTEQTEEKVVQVDASSLPTTRYSSGSRRLVVFDRTTGKQLWSRDAEFNFRHNNICLSKDRIFCIDSMTAERRQTLARRGIKISGQPTLYALDLEEGNVCWQTSENVFGTFLNYSEEYDLLLQAGSQYRDRAIDEVNKGMSAFRGADGKLAWENKTVKYGGPCLLWRDQIFTNGTGGFAIDLLTGKETDWKYARHYGCNTAYGSEHLLTFRSGSAGFYDLYNKSGTGNLGGFRSSCTNNLIVADGVLNAPDYTRTCTCTYQNQTSLAMIHMPEAEYWTFGATVNKDHVGINFAAPGDRRDGNGTLWQNEEGFDVEPKKPQEFRIHSSFVNGPEPGWIAGNGFINPGKITIKDLRSGKYTVRCHFLEPQNVQPGQRVFDVKLQNNVALKNIDVRKETGSQNTGLVKEAHAVISDGTLVLELHARTDMPPVISGVELHWQDEN